MRGSTRFPPISAGPIVLPSKALRTGAMASVGDTMRSYRSNRAWRPTKTPVRSRSSSAWSTAEIDCASINICRNWGVNFSACSPSRSTPSCFQ